MSTAPMDVDKGKEETKQGYELPWVSGCVASRAAPIQAGATAAV